MNTSILSTYRKAGQSQWLADSAVLLVAIVWGSSYITAKTAVAAYPVFLLLFVRFSLTVLLMLPFTVRNLKKATSETWKIGGIFGLFLLVIFCLETFGVAYTSATNAGFIISLCIVLVPVVEWIIHKKFPGFPILGIVLLSFVGTGLIILHDGYHFNVGDLLVLAAAVTRAVFMSLSQKMTAGKNIDSSTLTVIQLAVVAVSTGFLSFVLYGPSPDMLPQTPQLWLIIFYLAVFCTMFAFYVQLTVIRRTSPTRVGILLGTEPVFAALFAVLAGGESFPVQGWIGGLCIIVATFLGRYAEEKRRRGAFDCRET